MTSLLGHDVSHLKQIGALATAEEIAQQPTVWPIAVDTANEMRAAVLEIIAGLGNGDPIRIILTGAGSSAFVGDALAPYLRAASRHDVVSIATTDIVASPNQYVSDRPTLLVSFARSGNSPESVATFDLVEEIVRASGHLVVTCNPDGELAMRAKTSGSALCAVMPDGTNDRSFAMTSSFSSMYVFAMSVFQPADEQLNLACKIARNTINNDSAKIEAYAAKAWDRLVVLGAGGLNGIAHECSLKCLELAAGQVVVTHDTPLGFRHGPKSVVNGSTLTLLLRSSDAYTARYDEDLYQELLKDRQSLDVVDVGGIIFIQYDDASRLDDAWRGLCYLVFGQLLAFHRAIALGIGADNPCPTGQVNRVVQGVSIHPFSRLGENDG